MPVPDTGELRFSAIATEFEDSYPIRLSDYFKDNNSTIDTSHISSFPDTGNLFRLSLFRGKQRDSDVIETRTLYNDLQSLRTGLSGFVYNEVNNIRSVLDSYGYRLVATPTYNAMAERLTYQYPIGDITALGKFNRTYFRSDNALKLSNGFSNNTLNNHPYMCLALFTDEGLVGIATMLFREWTNLQTKRLKDIFYPSQDSNNGHDLYTYVLNADGTEVFDVGGKTNWNFSNRQRPGVAGYNASDKFSFDDGTWGFSIGRSVDGNNPGPAIRNYSNSYGIENYDWNDATGYYMWNNRRNTDAYAVYAFVRTDAY